MSVLVTSLRRGGQPSHGVRFNPKWIRRGLVAVYDRGLFYHVNGQVSAGTTTGGPKRMGGPLGVVDGFGSTFGTGTTDRRGSVGTLMTPPGARSIVAFVYAKSTGGGSLGRVFQHSSGLGTNAGDEGMWMGTGYLIYSRSNDTQAVQWRGNTTLPLNTWSCVGITSDQSSYRTLPTFYFNGRADGATEITALGSAPYSSRTTTLDIGNRADGTRNWDGMIGPILFFESLLTAQEHFDLRANPFQVYAERYWETYFDSAVAAGGPVEGSLSVTQGANTLTADGLLGGAVEGALTVTQGANTVTAVGHRIAIFDTEDRGTLDLTGCSVVPNGTTPTINIKNQYASEENTSGARNCFFHVTGVNGQRPVFDVDRSNMQVTDYTGKFKWSYTGEIGTWNDFTATTRETSPNVYRSQHADAFTQDTVYVAMANPWRIGYTLPWIQSLESSGFVGYAPSGSTSYQFETRSATSDHQSVAIAAQPLYSFKIGTGLALAPDGNPKRKLVMMSGVHASEDVANYALKGAVEFLVSSDPLAISVRAWFDAYVYPVVAAAGRAGGAQRAEFQTSYKLSDVNRAWDGTPVLETITKHKAAVLADVGSTVHVFMDFHGDHFSTNDTSFFEGTAGDPYGAKWDAAIDVHDVTTIVYSSSTEYSSSWFKANKSCPYSVTPECGALGEWTPASKEAFGAANIKAIGTLISQDEWGTSITGVDATQAANTVSATGTLAIQGVLDAAQAGNTVSATGGETPGVVGAAEVAQDGNSVSAAGAVEIAGALEVAQAGNTVASAGVGPTTLTAADLAAIAALVQSIVDAGVNVSKLNGATLYGSGTIGDKWRGTA